MQLNDTVVRTANPGIHWDSTLKGFGLRVGKTTRTFLVRVGRGRNHRIGRYPLITVAQARDHAKEALAHRTLGKVVAKAHAFDDAKKEFLDDCATRLKPSTLDLYTWTLNAQFKFGRKSIGDLTGKDILKC